MLLIQDNKFPEDKANTNHADNAGRMTEIDIITSFLLALAFTSVVKIGKIKSNLKIISNSSLQRGLWSLFKQE